MRQLLGVQILTWLPADIQTRSAVLSIKRLF